jgi:hypothetical protein
MGVVEQGALGARQLHDLLLELHTKGVGRPSSRIAVNKPPGTIPGNYPLEPFGMSITDRHPAIFLSQ